MSRARELPHKKSTKVHAKPEALNLGFGPGTCKTMAQLRRIRRLRIAARSASLQGSWGWCGGGGKLDGNAGVRDRKCGQVPSATP